MTLQTKTIVQDSVGQPQETWSDTAQVWTAFERAYKGSESFRDASDIRVALTYFWIRTRHRDDIAFSPGTHRWKYGDRLFDIISYEDPDGTRDEIHFLCREIQA